MGSGDEGRELQVWEVVGESREQQGEVWEI